MKLITMLDDERLSDEGGYIGFNPEILYVESLRAALRERDQYSREMMNEERSKNTLRSRVEELEELVEEVVEAFGVASLGEWMEVVRWMNKAKKIIGGERFAKAFARRCRI